MTTFKNMNQYFPCTLPFFGTYCVWFGDLIEVNIVSHITKILDNIDVVLSSDLGSALALSILHFRDICNILGCWKSLKEPVKFNQLSFKNFFQKILCIYCCIYVFMYS